MEEAGAGEEPEHCAYVFVAVEMATDNFVQSTILNLMVIMTIRACSCKTS